MDDIKKVTEDIKIKWIKISRENKQMSIEKRIQKIVNIPLEDVKNLMVSA